MKISKRVISFLLVIILCLSALGIKALAELELPQIIWQEDGRAVNKITGQLLTNCAGVDDTEMPFVIIDNRGYAMKRAASYEELINANISEKTGFIELNATDLPNLFESDIIMLIEDEYGNETEIVVTKANGYRSETELKCGFYTVIDCCVSGDNTGRYAVTAVVDFAIDENEKLLIEIAVDDSNPAIPTPVPTPKSYSKSQSTNETEKIGDISFPEKTKPVTTKEPEPTPLPTSTPVPEPLGTMGAVVMYTGSNNPTAEPIVTETAVSSPEIVQEMDTETEIEQENSEEKNKALKSIITNIIIIIAAVIAYFIAKKFMGNSESDKRG